MKQRFETDKLLKVVKHKTQHYIKFINLNESSVVNSIKSTAFRTPKVYTEPIFAKGLKLPILTQTSKEELNQLNKDTFLALTEKPKTKVNHAKLQQAMRDAAKLMHLDKLKANPVSIEEAAYDLPPTSSSGFPIWKKKRDNIKEAIFICYKFAFNNLIPFLSEFELTQQCFRVQIRELSVKLRHIFMMPFVVQIFQNMFALTFKRHFQRLKDENILTSYDYSVIWKDNSKTWTNLQKYNQTISLDYKSYDKTIPLILINAGMSVFRNCLVLEGLQNEIWKQVVQIESHSTIVSTINGKVKLYKKQKSLVSGTAFTNMLGSVANIIALCYVLREMGIDPLDLKQVMIKVKSDDTLIGNNCGISLTLLKQKLQYHFGLDVDLDKSEIFLPGKEIFYLGFYFTDRTKRAKSTKLLLRQITYSGTFITKEVIDDRTRLVSKAVSILGNCQEGYDLWYNLIWPILAKSFNWKGPPPDTFTDLSERESGGYHSTRKQLSIEGYLYSGWRNN